MTERKVDLTEQVLTMLEAAWLAGQSYEREAIVAWLHSCGDGICAECNANADLIESGEHLRGRR